jgi:hypothetical protein
VNTEPLQPAQAPVAPTSRKKHCTACHQGLTSGSFSSSQLRNRAAAPRCQTPCLQQQGGFLLSKDEEATCCRHYAAIGTVSNETPECITFFDNPNMVRHRLCGDGHSRGHLFCPLARHLSGMHPTHSLDAELLECRCRPDLNADRAPTEAAQWRRSVKIRRALDCSAWSCTQDTGSAARRPSSCK